MPEWAGEDALSWSTAGAVQLLPCRVVYVL